MTEQLLLPLAKYMASGIHIGTKFKTKFMDKYIYKIRADGLCVLNIQNIDERIKIASKFLNRFEPDEILVVCRREAGHKAIKAFSKFTGAIAIPGRYFPGTMTNPNYDKYVEPKVIIVCDPWYDKQAVKDALKVGIPIVALCDSNNITSNVDLVIPCNNKGKKSLGALFFILAREYLSSRGMEFKGTLKDFV